MKLDNLAFGQNEEEREYRKHNTRTELIGKDAQKGFNVFYYCAITSVCEDKWMHASKIYINANAWKTLKIL